uniref:NAD(P)-binding domain-containing protein n=1 Tax=Hemiselmis andersenii TaxID=464988 RepID=A0A7S1DP31_HEMAN
MGIGEMVSSNVRFLALVLCIGAAMGFMGTSPMLSSTRSRSAAISARAVGPLPRIASLRSGVRQGALGARSQAEGSDAGGSSGKTLSVAILGATGGVGRLTTAIVRSYGVKIRAVVRSPQKAKELLPDDIEVVKADLKNKDSVAAALKGVDAVIMTSGTTAFPTDRWKDGNDPTAVNDVGVKNVVDAIEELNLEAGAEGQRIKKVTLLTSIGVRRADKFPFSILNSFGVLTSMQSGERHVMDGAKRAGFSYTIVRPGRLVGGPFTNPDFAQLLKIEEGDLQSVECVRGDPDGFAGDCSRRSTAEALAQTLIQPVGDLDFALKSVEGNMLSQEKWDQTFQKLSRGQESLRLEFSDLDVDKFNRWLTVWGNGIITSGALFPPLPMPFRVDYPAPPTVGVDLQFLSVTVNGAVTEMGALELRLVKGVEQPWALVAKRSNGQENPFPGEEQLLMQLQDDLYRVTTNSQQSGERGGVWGAE